MNNHPSPLKAVALGLNDKTRTTLEMVLKGPGGGRWQLADDEAAQVAILVMHAGRNPYQGQPRSDVEHVWRRADPDVQAEVRSWVEHFGAAVAFAAGTGELSTLPPSAEKDLWTAVTSPGRVHEWRTRIAAAPTLRGRLALLLRAPLVNTDHLAHQLGRRPSRADIARAFVNRLRQAAHEIREMRSR